MAVADVGLIGLAVMGQNLILNMNDNGFVVCAFNRTTSKVDDFLNNEARGTKVVGAHSLEEFVGKLKKPRVVVLLVKAGDAVDAFIDKLTPFLEKNDIIVDMGNSHYDDSTRRCQSMKNGIIFVGSGVSGGEAGARHGCSIMPGGEPAAWPIVKPIFQSISAKANGQPCCEWVGKEGAGHFVKMVHNGIEYGDMQLICEAYSLLSKILGLSNNEMSDTFTNWNKGALDSYLIEITADILKYVDPEKNEYTVDKILDTAGQKGTGKWTGISALESGQPVTLVAEAVFARCLSSLKNQRMQASKIYDTKSVVKNSITTDEISSALYAAKIVSYAQGFMLMRAVGLERSWDLNFGNIALMWRGGCIIRSVFLGKIKEAFDKKPDLENLLFDEFFIKEMRSCETSLRKVVAAAVQSRIPVPALSSALAFFDGYTSEQLPHNLLQAQRDYFGAHTYQRIDDPSKAFHHTNWTGVGGTTASSSYVV